MGRFFNTIKALFPRARAFSFFAETNIYKFTEALSELPEHIRGEAEQVFLDLFPDTTRSPESWESAFALFFASVEYPKRRDLVSSLWQSLSGGQSATFLEGMLKHIDRRIRIVENVPLSNPRSSNIVDLCVCGNQKMRCGISVAVCHYRRGDASFVPAVIQNDITAPYAIPPDQTYWEFCFFVCRDVVRNSKGRILYVQKIEISAVWRGYVEYLILKAKPVHTTAVVFIDWKEG
jgi:hypothetical protein